MMDFPKHRTAAITALALLVTAAAAGACSRQQDKPAVPDATAAIEAPVAAAAEAPAIAEQVAPSEAKEPTPAPAAKPAPTQSQPKPEADPGSKPPAQPQAQPQDHTGHDMSAAPQGDAHAGH